MRIVFALVAVFAASVLSACVTAETLMLDERTAIISGSGDELSSPARVQQRIMLEAANAATARGFRYFVVQSVQDTTRRGVTQLPTQSYAQGNGTTTCSFGVCQTSATANGMTFGGGSYESVMPGSDVQVRFFREGEIDPATPGLWDAVSILSAQPKR